jgi:hypothetical protein
MKALGVVVGILLVVTGFTLVGLERMKRGAGRSGCGNNLKQIALSAIQYADDKRFFPHVHEIGALDGGGETSDGPRAIRTLTYFNYCDNPEVYVCPQSVDRAAVYPDEAKTDSRCFGWEGSLEDPAVSPLVRAGAGDRPLAQLTTLSYAWTRRGYTTNSMASHVVASDRASCNHAGALLYVSIDAHTTRVPEGIERLASVAPDGLALGVLLWDPHPAGAHDKHEIPEGAPFAIVFVGLVVVELARRARPRPEPGAPIEPAAPEEPDAAGPA